MNFYQSVQPKGLNMPRADVLGQKTRQNYNVIDVSSEPYDLRGVHDTYDEDRAARVDAERERVHAVEERLRGGRFKRARV